MVITRQTRGRRLSSFVGHLLLSNRGKVIISVVLGLSLWEVVGWISPPIIMVPFTETAVAFGKMVWSGELARHAAISFTELGIGFSMGAVIGLTGGLLAALSKTFHRMTDHWISVFYSIPYVALIPLFVVWFGVGMESKVVLVMYAVFIPLWLNTYIGITGVDPHLVEVANAFGAKQSQIVRWVVLPFALPILLVGFRLAFTRGFIAVIIGEMVASTMGLGFIIRMAGGTFNVDKLLAAIAVLALVSIAIVAGINWFQRRTVPWWAERGK